MFNIQDMVGQMQDCKNCADNLLCEEHKLSKGLKMVTEDVD